MYCGVCVTYSMTLATGVSNRDDNKAAGQPSLYSVSFTVSDGLGVSKHTCHCLASRDQNHGYVTVYTLPS